MSWGTPGADACVHRRKRRQAAGDSSGTPGEKSERARCLKCRLAETVAEVVALRKELLICEEEITQIAVSRAKKAGSHHLMQAENPIYVISFCLSENGQREEKKTDRREER